LGELLEISLPCADAACFGWFLGEPGFMERARVFRNTRPQH